MIVHTRATTVESSFLHLCSDPPWSTSDVASQMARDVVSQGAGRDRTGAVVPKLRRSCRASRLAEVGAARSTDPEPLSPISDEV